MRRALSTLAGLTGLVLAGGCAGGGVETAPVPGVPQAQLGLAQPEAECPVVEPVDDGPGRQVRGMWISSVYGGDWPGDPEAPVAKKKASYRAMLDTAKAKNLNAVFMQIRPAGDAFYPSSHEPWSVWLTGTPGKDPGWNPLQFLIDEAHARDLEFHAWFNPYRVGEDNDRAKLAPASPARKNPSWAVKYGKYLWYDPGLPQVQDLATKAVMEVVEKYDVDGVHFDDYFYPYPSDGDFPDAGTYKKYGGGFANKGDWRRDNVNKLVERLSTDIKDAKPWVKFGISPFGIWRNKSGHPEGSDTNGLDSYAQIYGDTRKWVKEGWLDYVLPQLYWAIGDSRADYATLVAWWSDLVKGTGVQLLIGQAGYRMGESSFATKADQISRHLTLNRKYPAVRGDVFFSATDYVRDKKGFVSALLRDHYRTPALIPPSDGGARPAAPTGLKAGREGGKVTLSWRGDATSYAVYRSEGGGEECAAVKASELLTTTRGTSVVDTTARDGRTYTYRVTALDRTHQESGPSRASVLDR
ncbi:glycoside hydrolase family 10 protein [Actinocorallia libanotica]|uniref:Family 10 glycosylhydrolase n=1 Tax=Actinocorallia libanotica TaxID=46162 RepID=A0ABN1S1N5_9ACTN